VSVFKIIGHKPQLELLRKILEEKRLPNAWLFAGIRGIGKRMVAERIAAEILCSDKVASHTHPDLFIVEPEKQRLLIDQMRELAQRVQFHPLEADAKIAIIDDADTMTDAAANSLLKLIEEPPSSTHFILITSATHRILPTIRSRCQIVSFAPLPDNEIAKFLIENDGLSEADATRVANIAQGSLGLARSITPEFIDEVIGRFEALRKNASAADICSASEVWAGEGDKAPLVLDLLAGWYRDKLRQAVDVGGSSFDTKSALDALKMVENARYLVDTTANKQLMFEQLLFNISAQR
jgi:DNA polymerase-3 subunit delta'